MTKNFVFVLPHLRVNTTSVARFKSLIQVCINKGFTVRILEFNFPISQFASKGHQKTDELVLEDYILANLISLNAETNNLQKLAFYFLNKGNSAWKIVNWLHQAIYKTDVFFARNKLTYQSLKLNAANETYVLAFGGPFSVFNFAYHLSNKLNAKLVLDYRDPWNFGYAPIDSSPIIHSLKKQLLTGLELKILKKAEKVITVSKSLKAFLPTEFYSKTAIFINGTEFTADDIVQVSPPKSFNIVYSGTIYNEQLVDNVFFEAFAKFVKNKPKDKIRLSFLGASDNIELLNILKSYNLTEFCEITDRLCKHELAEYYNNSALFLHLKYGERNNVITSKQSDYLFFGKPILLPVSDDGDIAESIIENNAGFVCNSVEENFLVLTNLFDAFLLKKAGKLNSPNLNITRDVIAKNYIDSL